MLAKAGIPKNPRGTHGYHNMRSVRCYKATKWVQICTEYDVMGWDMKPDNPLQHTTAKLTKNTYAEPGSDNIDQAMRRCVDKYPEAKQKFDKLGINVGQVKKNAGQVRDNRR